jgi:predicted DNA-binding transcriptional regulator AlpA
MEKPYIHMPELADLLGMTLKGLHNSVCRESFPIPTYKLGKRRVADKEVVSRFFNEKRIIGLSEITTN